MIFDRVGAGRAMQACYQKRGLGMGRLLGSQGSANQEYQGKRKASFQHFSIPYLKENGKAILKSGIPTCSNDDERAA